MRGQYVREVMTPKVTTLPAIALVTEAAQRMRDEDIGDVLVMGAGTLRGVLTDRDIVVRCVAAEVDVVTVAIGDICSADPVVVQADTPVGDAVQRLRDLAVRRLPVVDEIGRPIGVVSIGDFAVEDDPRSALADISAAPPNR